RRGVRQQLRIGHAERRPHDDDGGGEDQHRIMVDEMGSVDEANNPGRAVHEPIPCNLCGGLYDALYRPAMHGLASLPALAGRGWGKGFCKAKDRIDCASVLTLLTRLNSPNGCRFFWLYFRRA